MSDGVAGVCAVTRHSEAIGAHGCEIVRGRLAADDLSHQATGDWGKMQALHSVTGRKYKVSPSVRPPDDG